jgi:hypothetical protein
MNTSLKLKLFDLKYKLLAIRQTLGFPGLLLQVLLAVLLIGVAYATARVTGMQANVQWMSSLRDILKSYAGSFSNLAASIRENWV